jgi:malate synthase
MPDIEIVGPQLYRCDEILTPAALQFLALLERKFGPRRRELLERRHAVQARLDAGGTLDFLEETAAIREGVWTVAPIPCDLLDRRVEITGPPERKMLVNALNSGANVFMADLEDSTSPTWANVIGGQINLRDAVRREIDFTDAQTGKEYRLAAKTAVLFVRPRGWHLPEAHIRIDGSAMSGSLCDFGLYFFHNAKALLTQGKRPYFYLPKLESHLEARLWNDVFLAAQEHLGVPPGTIKATVLIETLPASFEMDEILWELRQHSAGLNCGRWDYIFSYIKKNRTRAETLLPDRTQVTMTAPFLRAYSRLVIQTCHRRHIHAMGGMAAQIPLKDDPRANGEAMAKVRADKEREAADGHDGTWVAHPALVPIAREVFDRLMPTANQIYPAREEFRITAADLLAVPEGTRTEAGLRQNIAVGIAYLTGWLNGNGCLPLFGLMEDAATAEISRVQVWQWRKFAAKLDDGRTVTSGLIRRLVDQEVAKLGGLRYREAADLFLELVEADPLEEFFTTVAYEQLSPTGLDESPTPGLEPLRLAG